MIFLDPRIRGFGNVASARADGLELEWSQQLGDRLRLDATLGYVDAEDNRNARLLTAPIGATPHLTGNLALAWRMLERTTLGLAWNHVGDRAAAAPESGEYDRIDLNLVVNGWLHPDLDLRLGIDNALDERTVHLITGPTGVTSLDYQDRIAWAQLRWRY